MRIRCYLSEIRGERSIREVARTAGIAAGELSRIEAGIGVPRDSYLGALEDAYGAKIVDWYPPSVLLAIEPEDGKLSELKTRMRAPLHAG